MVQNTILKIERDAATYTSSDFHCGSCSDSVLLICCTLWRGEHALLLVCPIYCLLTNVHGVTS